MNLISMININDDRKERKAQKAMDRNMRGKENGYSIYESLEYVKDNMGKNSLGLQMEMMKSFIR